MGSLQDYLRVRFDSMCNKHQSNSFVLPCEQGTVPAHKGSVPLCLKSALLTRGLSPCAYKQPSGNDALIISNSSFLPSIFK